MIRKLLTCLGIKPRSQPALLEPPSADAVSKKLCIVCKHKEDGAAGILAAKCMAPQNLRHDLVTGEHHRVWDYCSTHRHGSPRSDLCGRDGTWFAPVEFIKVERAK